MAVQSKRLSARTVETIKAPGRHADGGNLYLNVTASGARSWVFMYKFDGRQREMGLGPLRDISLASARDLAAQHRQSIRDGADPLRAKKIAIVTPTFGAYADALIETMKSAWRSPKHLRQWRMTLDVYAVSLRQMPIDQVSTEDVLGVLKPLWSTKPETASRLRGRIETVLTAASAERLRTGPNPAAWNGHLKALLPPPRPKGTRRRFVAMPIDDVPAFMPELRKVSTIAARALEFTILTAARSGETYGALWAEIDFARRTWTVPASRMKAVVEHRIPLCDWAIEVLQEMQKVRRGDLVFAGPRTGKLLANTSLTRTLAGLRPGLTVHGFRSTFRDWVSERTGFPSDVAEMALAHTIADQTEAAYRRGDLFEKRRKLMDAWAAYLGSESTGSKVVTLSSRQQATA